MIDEPTTTRQQDLDHRVRELTAEVAGEKYVTRHVLEQANLNADDLGTIKTDMRHLKGDMSLVRAVLTHQSERMNTLVQDVTLLRQDVTLLRRDMEALHAEMDRRFDAIERRMDERFDAVLEAIRTLAPRGEG